MNKIIGLAVFSVVIYAVTLIVVNMMYAYWSEKTDERCFENLEQICYNVCKEACDGDK
jgi:hypothetical protein